MEQQGTEKKFRYEIIADATLRSIDGGLIPYGEKLPSLREMSHRYACSVSVVMQAYAELEGRGRIRAVEKSGFYALPPPEETLGTPPEPPKERYTLKSEKARPLSIIGRIVEAGNLPDMLPLGAGLPDASLLPLAALKKCLTTVTRDDANLFGCYTDEAGDQLLRDSVSRYMNRRFVDCRSEDILITNGCTEALELAILSASEPGRPVAVESPVFLGVLQILNETGREVIPIPTSPRTGMDMEALESVLAAGETNTIVLTPAFQNPLGFVMPEENRRRTVELANRYDAVIIEDDIYGDCSHSHKIHRPIKSFDTEERVVYCSSFSKTVAPGMRIGWMNPGRLLRKVGTLKMSGTLGGSPLLQRAMAYFLEGARYGRHIKSLRKGIAGQTAAMRTLLIDHLPPGTQVSAPQGGYYLWAQLPGGLDSVQLFHRALEEGISIAPGAAFGNDGRYSDCIRISCGSPVTDATERGIRRLAGLIREQPTTF